MSKKTVVVIVGPTASGKTSISIEIAKRKNGEIISADSMQIYKGMDIASAKPTSEERSRAVHHLVDFVEPTQSFSVAKYKKAAYEKIEEILSRGKLPIIVGGTGLYVDAVINNTEFLDYEQSDIRQRLETRAQEEGIEVLFNELERIDPNTAERLHLNDRKRILRALEVYYSTGKTLTEQNELSHKKESDYNFLLIELNARDRQYLYNRINKRVDLMMEQGLLSEAKDFFSKTVSSTAKQAIGYKELKPYLDSEISLNDAVEKLKMETRRYAKRQLTWFRKYSDRIETVYIDENEPLKRCIEIIDNYERNNGYE